MTAKDILKETESKMKKCMDTLLREFGEVRDRADCGAAELGQGTYRSHRPICDETAHRNAGDTYTLEASAHRLADARSLAADRVE